MSEKKLDQLFQAARGGAAPPASATLAEDVVRALRQAPPDAMRLPPSFFEELNVRFTRLALTTVVVLALGVAINVAQGTVDPTDLGDSLTQISAPWWLLTEGF